MKYLAILAAGILMLTGCSVDNGSDAEPAVPASTVGAARTEARMSAATSSKVAVRHVVERFGRKLKMVSTLAPPDAIRQQVRVAYGGLVAPSLLEAWEHDPPQAPGKDVSSPWPESIDIQRITCATPRKCTVAGSVRYVTSVEMTHGGGADRRAIHMQLHHGEHGWRIVSVNMQSRG